MIESSCLSNGILTQSICCMEEKFVNEGEQKEPLFLILKRNTNSLSLFSLYLLLRS